MERHNRINQQAREANLIVLKLEIGRESFFRIFHLEKDESKNQYGNEDYIYKSQSLDTIYSFILGYATARQKWPEHLKYGE